MHCTSHYQTLASITLAPNGKGRWWYEQTFQCDGFRTTRSGSIVCRSSRRELLLKLRIARPNSPDPFSFSSFVLTRKIGHKGLGNGLGHIQL